VVDDRPSGFRCGDAALWRRIHWDKNSQGTSCSEPHGTASNRWFLRRTRPKRSDEDSCAYAHIYVAPTDPATEKARFAGILCGPGWIRTNDLGIKSPLLCQLSYRPATRVSVEGAEGHELLEIAEGEHEEILGVGAAVLATAALAFAGVAQAETDNAALIVRDTGCFVFGVPGGLVFTTDSQLVENKNLAHIVCRADVPNDSGKSVRYDQDNNPFGPGTFYNCVNGAIAETWHQTISASGKSISVIDCNTSR
jgi:hypothetical protein